MTAEQSYKTRKKREQNYATALKKRQFSVTRINQLFKSTRDLDLNCYHSNKQMDAATINQIADAFLEDAHVQHLVGRWRDIVKPGI